ncbi:type I-E CRISPR-associated protein Cas6/Cse3/CasE [Paeniglutamicibacter sp. NPDC091659]|uniref:type I-E CRISPR-associated protein Cas6/Cse3/CasE n=1 Tax=Paeniglutamicibacter sp. NPDC091659 TaxID=3364389 RepID=UPI00380C3561
MTFRTRIAIDPTSRSAMPYLTNPHRLHGAIMKMFSPAPHGQAGEQRVLWRIDSFATSTWLYVVSTEEPATEVFHKEAGLGHLVPESQDYSRILNQVKPGGIYGFRLTANTMKAAVDLGSPNSKRPELTRGKRVPIIHDDQKIQWLQRQGESHGFSILESSEHGPMVRIGPSGNRKFKRNHSTVTLHSTQFDGTLRVDDVDALRAAMVSGIGRGKAYGLGLLSLTPASA